MIVTVLGLVRFGFSLLFGVGVTVLFAGIVPTPLILFLSLFYKRPWLISTVSVLSGYLCCQAPRWVGFLRERPLAAALLTMFAISGRCFSSIMCWSGM